MIKDSVAQIIVECRLIHRGNTMKKKRMSVKEKRRIARRKQIMVNCGIFGVTIVSAIAILIAGFNYINKPKLVDGSEQIPAKVAQAQNSEGANEITKAKDTASLQKIGANQESKYPVPGWQINDKGWWYEDENKNYYVNGWKTIKGVRYYFNESGYMATGWNIIDGEDYYFDESGQVDENVQPKLVAMTFDDGPSKYTDHLLDVLEENNSKATFFMVGNQLEQFPDTAKRMHAMGMELGNHTWDHTYLRKANPKIMYQKFDMLDSRLKEIVGVESTLYRTPGGGESDEYRAGAKKPLLMWSLDTLDWKTLSVEANISSVLDNVQDGDIVLMHDLHQTSVQACDTIIPELRKRGFKLVTVSELAQARGIEMQSGVDYFSMKPNNNEEQKDTEK